MTDLAVDRLRIRGPGARRLAEVAARELPAALEGALGDLADVRLETITVRLDLDPDDYDAATLAVLWADAIRAQVLAAGGRSAPPVGRGRPDPPVSSGDNGARPSQDSPADVAALAADYLARPLPDQHTIPRSLLSLSDPGLAAAVAARLGRPAWWQLVARLRDLLLGAGRSPSVAPTSPPQAAGQAEGPGPATEDEDGRQLSAHEHPRAGPPAPGSDPSAEPFRQATGGRLELTDLVSCLATLGDLVDEHASAVDVPTVTRAAGLALLWPWLADVCREAVRSAPGAEEHRLRAHVLARLADPDDAGLLDDPLVRLLAGVPEDDHVRVPSLDSWLPAVDESADRVLATFAGLLPGFASSTPRFVRDQWVLRLGLLDVTTTPAGLVAATHPLDVLLPKLPYPVALFKLPWSAPVSVRFRP